MIIKPPLGAYLNKGHWASRGFIGCWLMNTGNGNIVYDYSLNDNHGSISSTATWITGDDGKTLQCNGSSAYVDIGDVINETQGTFQIRFRPLRMYDYNTIFDNASDGNDWEMWIYSDGELAFRPGGANDMVRGDSSGHVCVINQYYDVIVTWDDINNYVALYIDGVLIDDINGDGYPAATNSYIAGNHISNTDGEIDADYVRIWDRVLSYSEIKSLNLYPFQMFEEDELPLLVGAISGIPYEIYVYDTDEEMGNVA